MLDAAKTTLAERLKAAGYATAGFVGAFVLDSKFGLDQGFDLYDDSLGRSRTRVSFSERPASQVVASARNWISGRGQKLFFAWVHLFDPHMPYVPHGPTPAASGSEDALAQDLPEVSWPRLLALAGRSDGRLSAGVLERARALYDG